MKRTFDQKGKGKIQKTAPIETNEKIKAKVQINATQQKNETLFVDEENKNTTTTRIFSEENKVEIIKQENTSPTPPTPQTQQIVQILKALQIPRVFKKENEIDWKSWYNESIPGYFNYIEKQDNFTPFVWNQMVDFIQKGKKQNCMMKDSKQPKIRNTWLSWNDIIKKITLLKKIGQGAYGVVYLVDNFIDAKEMYQIALKVSRVQLQMDAKKSGFDRCISEISYETFFAKLVSQLIENETCPFFLKFHSRGENWWKFKDTLCYYVYFFQEYSKGICLRKLSFENQENRLFCIISQIFNSCIAMSSVLSMCHNDLYTRNILIEKTRENYTYHKFVYSDGEEITYRFATDNCKSRICDFSKSSLGKESKYSFRSNKTTDISDHYQSYCYPLVGNKTSEFLNLDSIVGRKDHVLYWDGVDPYARDMISFLSSVISNNEFLKQEIVGGIKLWTISLLQLILKKQVECKKEFSVIDLFECFSLFYSNEFLSIFLIHDNLVKIISKEEETILLQSIIKPIIYRIELPFPSSKMTPNDINYKLLTT